MSSRMRDARLTFMYLRNLWDQHDIRLPNRCSVLTVRVRLVLIYRAGKWRFQNECVWVVDVFRQCLRHVSKKQCVNPLFNSAACRRWALITTLQREPNHPHRIMLFIPVVAYALDGSLSPWFAPAPSNVKIFSETVVIQRGKFGFAFETRLSPLIAVDPVILAPFSW